MMYCPEQIVFNSRKLMLMCHTSCDWIHGAPLRELLNPLRYSVTLWPGTPHYRTFNENGRAWITVSNFLWRLRG